MNPERNYDNWYVPVDKVRPFVVWLEGVYGTLRDVSEGTGIPTRTLQKIKQRKHSNVAKATALEIVEAVQALRRGGSSWSIYENEETPRYPNYTEQAQGYKKRHEKKFDPVKKTRKV